MTDYVYDKSGQDIHFQREGTTYGLIYDPESTETVWTKISAAYAHWRKLDYIPDALDMKLPLIEKLRIFDIGDSKHASAIQDGNIEPIDFTIDMNAQGLEFLMFAIGAPAYSSHGQAMIQTITCPAEATNIVQGDYFLIDAITSNVVEHFAVWMDTVGNGTTGKPTIAGINASNVLAADINGTTPTSTAAEIAAAVKAIIDADATFGASNAAAVVTVTNAANGAVMPARDSGAAPTECTFSITTWGSTTYTVAEALTTDLPSFTIHLEQRNTTAAENIIWDLFGCVVESVDVNVAFGDKVVKYSVGMRCPYAVEGNAATNLPGKKLIDGMPSMSSLIEGTDAVLIQDGATATVNDMTAGDKTPTTVEKVVLSINNSVSFQPDIAKQHMVRAIAGKREVKMNVVGATQEKELFNFWQEQYKLSGSDYIPNTATGKINTTFKLQRDATYDYVSIHIYNWLILEHNFVFVNVDDAVKMVDLTFVDGSADSNGRILDATTFVSYIDRTLMVV